MIFALPWYEWIYVVGSLVGILIVVAAFAVAAVPPNRSDR